MSSKATTITIVASIVFLVLFDFLDPIISAPTILYPGKTTNEITMRRTEGIRMDNTNELTCKELLEKDSFITEKFGDVLDESENVWQSRESFKCGLISLPRKALLKHIFTRKNVITDYIQFADGSESFTIYVIMDHPFSHEKRTIHELYMNTK